MLVPPTSTASISSILPMHTPRAVGVRRDAAAPEALLRVHPGVLPAQVAAAIDALRQVPAADRALLAQAGLMVDLLPTARLEGEMIGATQVEQDGSGPWTPKSIRVAAHAGITSSPTAHVVVHEVGHAVEVLRRQDRTEDAAERYVQGVLRSGADQAITAARIRSEHRPSATASGSEIGLGVGVASAAVAAIIAALLVAS